MWGECDCSVLWCCYKVGYLFLKGGVSVSLSLWPGLMFCEILRSLHEFQMEVKVAGFDVSTPEILSVNFFRSVQGCATSHKITNLDIEA